MNGTLVLMEEKPAESLFINMNEADLENYKPVGQLSCF